MVGTRRGRARRLTLGVAMALVAGVLTTPPAHATLAAVGPTDPGTGFPNFYADPNGMRLELCLDGSPSPCFSSRPNQAQPATFPGNFPVGDAAYFVANASIVRPVRGIMNLELGLLASFRPAVAAGNQVTFGHELIHIDNLVTNATYTITYPFGTRTLPAQNDPRTGTGVIDLLTNVGCMAPPCGQNFGAALSSEIGPFLTWDPRFAPAAPAGYIGDFATPHAVVGSPTGNNLFRVDGPNAGGPGVNTIQTNLFSVSGKLGSGGSGVASAPQTLTATTGPAAGQITLSWTAPATTGTSPLTGYNIYRGTTGVGVTPVATVAPTATSFTDSALPANTTEIYAVTALNSGGEGPQSNQASARTLSAPSAPNSVTASAKATLGQIGLSWSIPSNTGGTAITGYNIYRGDTADTLALLTSVAASPTSFTDTGLPEGATRFYAVTAVNAAGEGTRSFVTRATTLSRPAAPAVQASAGPALGQLTVRWAPVSDGGTPITGYRVLEVTSNGTVPRASVGPAVQSFSDTGLGNGATHSYVVVATNAVGDSPDSAVATATTFDHPSAPQNVSASAGSAIGDTTVQWAEPAGDGGRPLLQYRVYRASGTSGFALVAQMDRTHLSFTDHGLGPLTMYHYVVTGVNVVGEGPGSTPDACSMPYPIGLSNCLGVPGVAVPGLALPPLPDLTPPALPVLPALP